MNILTKLFKKANNSYRQRRAWGKHKKIEDYWKDVVTNYFDGKLDRYELRPKQELSGKQIIWQYWGQGFNNGELPEVVSLCFESVDKYKGDYEVIRLSDETVRQYIDLPDFVYGKMKAGSFNRTFFSDLLRLALLDVYGGVWLDATILLTGPLPADYTTFDYFVYQRDDQELNKAYWENMHIYYWGWHPNFKVRMLNSIIFAKRGSVVVSTLLNLILHYWKTQNQIIGYYFFQVLYNLLIQKQFANERCPIVSDTLPHLLQARIKYPDGETVADEDILKLSSIHKLSYFKPKALERFKIFYERNALGISHSSSL